MSLLHWADEYSVGIESFDNDHKKLIMILNKLFDALSKGEAQNLIFTIVMELKDYTQYHFNSEEDAFLKHLYPDYESHKDLHDNFLKKIKDFELNYVNKPQVLAIPVFNLLMSWIKEHIQKVDKNYSNFLKNKGMK